MLVHEKLPRKAARISSLIVLFIAGGAFPVLNNAILGIPFPWRNGLYIEFQKPWFQNCMMFMGMALFIVPSFVMHRCRCSRETDGPVQCGFIFRAVAIPSILNIIATLLQNYALMYMSTTAWQLFHGFQMLFTTLFAVTYRKQQLLLIDWLGLFVTVLGMCFAGVGSLLRGIDNETSSITTVFIALLLVILSHGLKSFQFILEEQLTHDSGVTPLDLTAYEGIWGTYLCVFVCMPITNILNPMSGVGIYENTLEAFELLSYSGTLVLLLVFYIISITAYNYAGVYVVSYSSAIHRGIYEMIRPFIVWIISTVTYYITKIDAAGEKMDENSAFEMVGFGICVLGMVIYNRILKLPCFTYSPNMDDNDDLESIADNLILQ